jgi:hypothetical protein
MDIVKTMDDAVPFLSAYPPRVKILVAFSILLAAISIIALLFSPKTVPVERWLIASDEATIKAFAPGEWFQDWKTKQQTANDLIRQREKRAADQLGVGENPPSSSGIDSTFLLKVQKAEDDRNSSQYRIEEYIRLDLLAKGKLIARGITNEAAPHDNDQILIKPAQWQYLRLLISSGDAIDIKGTTVFKGIEIGRPKG